MKTILLLLSLVCISLTLHAQETKSDEYLPEYRPGGAQWAKVWKEFYNNSGCEGELMNPLVHASKAMTPVIIEAIAHQDMKLRRYAIGAIGWRKDKTAIPALEKILTDETEDEVFRGDAMQSIFVLDRSLGKRYAAKYKTAKTEYNYLQTIGEAIEKNESWLTTYPDMD
jgi:hypothetical protein